MEKVNPYAIPDDEGLTFRIAMLLIFWFAVRILFTVAAVGIAIYVILVAANVDNVPGIWP